MFQRDDLRGQQPVALLLAKALYIQRRALREGVDGAYVVDARQVAAQPFEHLKSSDSGVRPPRQGLTENVKPACWCRLRPCSTSGATTGTSAAASSRAKACSSRI